MQSFIQYHSNTRMLKLSSFLISTGFEFSEVGHSLYTKVTSHGFTTIIDYVDDVVVIGDSLKEIEFIKQALDTKFKIKDLGQLRYFLGFETARNNSGVFFNQHQYTLKLL